METRKLSERMDGNTFRDISNFISLLPGVTEAVKDLDNFQPMETPLETGKENGLIAGYMFGNQLQMLLAFDLNLVM